MLLQDVAAVLFWRPLLNRKFGDVLGWFNHMAMKKVFFTAISFLNPLLNGFYRNRLKVLAFHTVPSAAQLEEKIIYLKKTHSIIDFATLERHIKNKTPLPPKPLLITFDDGDYSVYEKGVPVLSRHNVPSILFVVTGLINTYKPFWWKHIEANYPYAEARRIIKEIKTKSNAERLALLKSLKVNIDQRQLTSAELKEIEMHQMLVGNHTATHPVLTSCTAEEVTSELTSAKEFFRHENLQGYRVFAYPNGNGNGMLRDKLVECGVGYIFLFDHRINKAELNQLALSRIMVDVSQDPAEFRARVSGIHSLLMRAKK